MVCLPATQFCCGCTVTFGVKSILLLNLAMNVSVVALTIGYLVFGIKGMALGFYWVEALMLGVALAGLPIILSAFHGVLYRNEAQIRVYLYYMWFLIAVAVGFILKMFVFSGSCNSIGQVMNYGEGSAWACGMTRWIRIGTTAVSLSILCYFQHVVYSYCEDLNQCGGGPDLADLMLNKDAYSKRWQPDCTYSSIEGMADLADRGELWETAIGIGSPYDKAVSSGMGGGTKLFGGRYHDLSYPSTQGMVTAF